MPSSIASDISHKRVKRKVKRVAKIKVYKNKLGRYVKIKGKIFYISDNTSDNKIRSFVRKQVRKELMKGTKFKNKDIISITEPEINDVRNIQKIRELDKNPPEKSFNYLPQPTTKRRSAK